MTKYMLVVVLFALSAAMCALLNLPLSFLLRMTAVILCGGMGVYVLQAIFGIRKDG